MRQAIWNKLRRVSGENGLYIGRAQPSGVNGRSVAVLSYAHVADETCA